MFFSSSLFPIITTRLMCCVGMVDGSTDLQHLHGVPAHGRRERGGTPRDSCHVSNYQVRQLDFKYLYGSISSL